MNISPESKVGDLLDAFPEAEEALIAIAPRFKALKNPVLRRTVAKVATLEQAARVADMPVNELVRSLRQALGQDVGEVEGGGAHAAGSSDAPAWIADGAKHEFDADGMLARGETPVGKVSEALAGMAAGEALLVRSTFQVAPLIDAMKAKGHEVFTRKTGDDAWEAWMRRI
jgi:TusA-related sulfurtransferase